MNRGYTLLYIRRLLSLAVAVSALLTLGGCSGSVFSNYLEIASLQPVQTLGFDYDDGLSVATVSTGKGLEGQPAVLISRSGQTLSDCFRSLQDYSAKNQLFFEQSRSVLIGESAAKNGMTAYFDYMEREGIPRLDNKLFIVRGGEAQALITGSGDSNYDISECLSTIERDTKLHGEGYPFTCLEVLRSLNEFGSALVCAIKSVSLADSVFSESGAVTAVPCGFAIVAGDRLAGYIDPEYCPLGANILLGRPGEGTVKLTDDTGGIATLTLRSGKADYSAEWDGGKLTALRVKVDLKAELTSFSDMTGDPSPVQTDSLRIKLQNEAKSSCESVLDKSRELGCDFLGLAYKLRSSYPAQFAALDTDFPSALAEADISVEVNALIVQTHIATFKTDGKEAQPWSKPAK